MPLGAGANLSNIGFHAPPQEPGWANDGTVNNQGYSSMPWTVTQNATSITWNTETFGQNQNANAIRFGTLYNFRFDADQPPQTTNATVGFFKTGSPMMVAIQAPAGGEHLRRRLRRHQPPRPHRLPPLRHGNCNTQAHSNTKDQSFAEASSNSATAPLAVLRQAEQKSKEVVRNLFWLVSQAREKNDDLIFPQAHP